MNRDKKKKRFTTTRSRIVIFSSLGMALRGGLRHTLIDANARTGKRIEGCDDGRVLGAYGRDELNNNGK